MKTNFSKKLSRVPVLGWGIKGLQKIRLSTNSEWSLYDLIELYIIGIVQGALTSRAGAVAFSLFMAIFPLLIFLITLLPFIVPYVPVDDFESQFLQFIQAAVPGDSGNYLVSVFEEIQSQKRSGLLSTTFVLTLFLIANGVSAILSVFENSYHVELSRNFFRQYAVSLLLGLLIALFIVVSAVAYVCIKFYTIQILSRFDYSGSEFTVISIIQMVVIPLSIYFFTSLIYFFGTKEGVKGSFFTLGAVMTTGLFMATFYFFGIYLDNFSSYNKLYGALGGLLALMLFIWLNSNILLLGFELNATIRQIERQSSKS
jgi:membrane protein